MLQTHVAASVNVSSEEILWHFVPCKLSSFGAKSSQVFGSYIQCRGFRHKLWRKLAQAFWSRTAQTSPLTCQQQSIKSYDVETEVHVWSTRHCDRKMWQTHTNSRGVNHLVALWYTPHSDRSRKGKHRWHVHCTVRTNTTSTSNNSINNKFSLSSWVISVKIFRARSAFDDTNLLFRVHVQSSVAYEQVLVYKGGDTLGDFIRRSRWSAYKISGISIRPVSPFLRFHMLIAANRQ